MVSLKYLVLLAGDFENNPGPNMQEAMAEIRKMAADISEIKKENKIANESLANIHAKLDTLAYLESRVVNVEDRIAELELSITHLVRQVDDLENRSRRSNMIIYGMKEDEDETCEGLE